MTVPFLSAPVQPPSQDGNQCKGAWSQQGEEVGAKGRQAAQMVLKLRSFSRCPSAAIALLHQQRQQSLNLLHFSSDSITLPAEGRMKTGGEFHDRTFVSARSLLFLVDIQSDFFFAVLNGHISFGRGNDDGLPRGRGAELFGKIDLDREHRSLDGHLYIFHDGALSVMDEAPVRSVRIMVQPVHWAEEEVNRCAVCGVRERPCRLLKKSAGKAAAE